MAVAASLGSLWFVVRLVERVKPANDSVRRRDDRAESGGAVPHGGRRPRRRAGDAGGGGGHLLRRDQRELPATVALTVGALVKHSAAVPLVLLIAYVATRAEPASGAAVRRPTSVPRPASRSSPPFRSCSGRTRPSAWWSSCSTGRESRRRRWSSASSRRWAPHGRRGRGQRRRDRRAARDVRGARDRAVHGHPPGAAPREGRLRVVPGRGVGLVVPAGDAVLAHVVPVVLRLGATGCVGAAPRAAQNARAVVPRAGDGRSSRPRTSDFRNGCTSTSRSGTRSS